jgi:hypothetical protein
MNAIRFGCFLLFGSVACGGSSSAPIVSGDGGGGGLDAGGDGRVMAALDGYGGCPTPVMATVDVPVPASPNGGRCGGVYAVNSTCSDCVTQNCCDTESACGQNAACVADIQCAIACSSLDASCPAACDQTYASGAGLLGDLRSCEAAKCATECSQEGALTFDCTVVCVDHGPSGTAPGLCKLLAPDGGIDAATLVECDFESPPCDPASP